MVKTKTRQVRADWNDTHADRFTDVCVHQLFGIQVEQNPDACAVIFKDQSITYCELNRRANQLAWNLLALGAGPDIAIGICADRSIETIVGLLGILKTGGCCLPLDPEYPKERLAFMLQDGDVELLLTEGRFAERLSENKAKVIRLDATFESSQMPEVDPPTKIGPDNLAYIIYTSGSTGTPKGVEVPHRGIVQLLFGVDYVNLDKTKTVLQLSALTFDGSIFDIWGALLHGGRSLLYPGRIPTIHELGDLLRKNHVTTAFLTTSLFNAIVDEDPTVLACLEQLLIGGEALSVSHIRRAWSHLTKVEIINAYGPTEATVFACSYHIRTKPDAMAISIPIGQPIGDSRAFILDENMQPVPVGTIGELYLGGPGIVRGYRKRPELTARSFISDPFSRNPSMRLYRTGDLARKHSDGYIDFLGRTDSQVKVRGHRIELGEIEATLRRHSGVRDAIVLVYENPRKERHLSAFVVRKPTIELSADELRQFLRHELPEFMVPSRYCVLERWPLTSSSKVDRQALANMRIANGKVSSATMPARTPLEKELVRIWEQILDDGPIGVKDNFFDLGGDSLQAVLLHSKIEEVFGRRLPIAALLSAPTIEELAVLLDVRDSSGKLAYALPLQSAGEEPPFFCVGAGLLLRPLSVALGSNQPFYSIGIEPDGVSKLMVPSQIEELAQHLMFAMRERQPQGPYFLGGFCQDGVIAYEVARQLMAQSQEVALLALFETENPSQTVRVRIEKGLKRLLIRMGFRVNQSFRMRIGEIPHYFSGRKEEFNQLIMRTLWNISSHFKVSSKRSGAPNMEQILFLAARSYKPKPLACPTVLFQSKNWPIASAGDPYFGWRELLTGRSETYEVPGVHARIFSEPNVKVLADLLKVCLRRAKLANTSAHTVTVDDAGTPN